MRFDWYEFLLLARELLGVSTVRAIVGALQRTAISRSYYAAFSIARKYVREVKQVRPPRLDAHQFVIDYFKNSDDQTYSYIADALKELRAMRNKANYEEFFVGLPAAARRATALAGDVIIASRGL